MSELEGVGLTRRVRGGDLDILLLQVAASRELERRRDGCERVREQFRNLWDSKTLPARSD